MATGAAYLLLTLDITELILKILVLLQLWHIVVGAAQIQSLAQELQYAASIAIQKKKKRTPLAKSSLSI